jgi:polyisoprenoid-binding protein YceI
MAWQIDSAHSEVTFSARHMMISKVRGRFNEFSGTINFDEENPSASTVDVTIQADSISTRNADRDGHLKSADFLNVAEYPTITFVSTNVEQTDDDEGKLTGNLTIAGVTKPVTLKVEYAGQAQSPWGMTSAGFSGSTKIDRRDFDLTWNAALETGGVLVGNDIKIEIELELIKQPDAVPA